MQNKAVAEQGLEEGEEEENRGKEEVEDMGLGWMEACCTALELHAAEPAVQVSSMSSSYLATTNIEPGVNPIIKISHCLRKLQAGPFTICYCTELE